MTRHCKELSGHCHWAQFPKGHGLGYGAMVEANALEQALAGLDLEASIHPVKNKHRLCSMF